MLPVTAELDDMVGVGAVVAVVAVAVARGGNDPFYADPLFDAAHDAEFVWHEQEQVWWMIYLQVCVVAQLVGGHSTTRLTHTLSLSHTHTHSLSLSLSFSLSASLSI
jgi:hypothetical protein